MSKKPANARYFNNIEEAVKKTFSDKRIKLLEKKSRLSSYIIGKIVFDKRWETFNLAGEFQKWVQKGDVDEVSNWLRDNYERLNVSGAIKPNIKKLEGEIKNEEPI